MTKSIYAIRHPHGYYKIGVSEDPYSRFQNIKSHTPYRLELYAVLRTPVTDFSIETEIHNQLEDHNWKLEWFNVSTDILDGLLESYANKNGFELSRPRINAQSTEDESFTVAFD